jgi:hypothetical protein
MPTVEDFATAEEFERFARCRAAAFVHLDGAHDPMSVVPRPVARTLLDQIDFIAGLFVSEGAPQTVEDVQAKLSVAERFFLGFNRTLIATAKDFEDVGRRDSVLLGCVPWIWANARVNIDHILTTRLGAPGGPTRDTPEAANARLERAMRKLEAE